jgi:hypothetical protein
MVQIGCQWGDPTDLIAAGREHTGAEMPGDRDVLVNVCFKLFGIRHVCTVRNGAANTTS